MMKKYQVLEESSASALERAVEKSLQKGWTLHGGVSVACCPDDREVSGVMTIYVQAMVRDCVEEE